MRHGNAATSVTPQEWMDAYRPALYRQCAATRRMLMRPENPTPAQRATALDLLALVEAVLGATEPMDGSADERIRLTSLNDQARLLTGGA